MGTSISECVYLYKRDKCPTHGFAGLRGRVHLVTFIALALVISLVVDADLTAGVWVLTFVYVCGEKRGTKT